MRLGYAAMIALSKPGSPMRLRKHLADNVDLDPTCDSTPSLRPIALAYLLYVAAPSVSRNFSRFRCHSTDSPNRASWTNASTCARVAEVSPTRALGTAPPTIPF